MNQYLALLICILFVVWLFARDQKTRPMTSWVSWIVLVWILIISIKPVTVWLDMTTPIIEKPEDYMEGSPFDRAIYFFLIFIGLMILVRRKPNWKIIFSSNLWLFVFFIYCGISIVWSDYPFVSLKRWIKDIGNIIIVLIILTDINPAQTFKAVFARFSYLVLPFSLLFIKYFPDLGRYYNRWTYEPYFCGVAGDKNALGAISFISGLFLTWNVLELMSDNKKINKLEVLSHVLLLAMVFWLIFKSQSSTSLVCLLLGIVILVLMQHPSARKWARYLGTFGFFILFMATLLYSFPGVLESFVAIVGRDLTFTGRTDIWSALLKEPINPLLGTGYQSFWLGPGAEHLWERYYFLPNQAHNGYLETYLNGGVIGLCLLVAAIIATGKNLKKELLKGNSFGTLLFSFMVVFLLYNWTEAVFNKLSPIWFILLIAAFDHSRTLTKNVLNKSPHKLVKPRASGNVILH